MATLSGKQSVLGVHVDPVDYDCVVDLVLEAATARKPLSVTALAVHGIMTGVLNLRHRWRLNRLDIVTPDGQPVRWALNLLYRCNLSDRVYGPELMGRICKQAAKGEIPIFLYGSRPEVLESLGANLRSAYPNIRIAGAKPSLFRKSSETERLNIVRDIRDSGAGIVFVGLGCPRQEVWVYEYAEALSLPAVAVGAAFDFHAGVLPQAPAWLQRRGLEWAFRLAKEPRRLWRRYVLLNPLFVILFLAQALRIARFSSRGRPPKRAENYA